MPEKGPYGEALAEIERLGDELARKRIELLDVRAEVDRLERAGEGLAVIARLVAESWRDAAMRWGDLPMEGRVIAHPLACVLAALDGETDPIELGIAPTDAFFERIREAAADA